MALYFEGAGTVRDKLSDMSAIKEYGSWGDSTDTHPFEASDSFPSLSLAQRTEPYNNILNPFKDVTLAVSDASASGGDYSWDSVDAPDGTYRMMGALAVNTSRLQLQVSGLVSFCTYVLRVTFYKPTADIDTFTLRYNTWDGTEVASEAVGTASDIGEYINVEFEFDPTSIPVTSDDFSLFLVKTAGTGTTSQAYISSYQFILKSTPIADNTGAAYQFKSPDKGVLLPQISDLNAAPDEQGAVALDFLSGNRPVWNDGNGWSYFVTQNFGINASPYTVFYFADLSDGTPESQGWSIPYAPSKVNVVENQYGFPALLNIVDDTSSSPVGIERELSTDMIQAMWQNGFRWDFSVRVDSGSVNHYVQVTSTYGGGNGRWRVLTSVSGSNLNITEPSGGSASVNAAKVAHISMRVPGNSTNGEIYVDGVFAFNIPFESASPGDDKVLHTSGASGSTDEDFWLRDTILFSVQTTDVTIPRESIESGIRYNIPNAYNPITVTIPKGTYPSGSAFTIVNGSSSACTVTGAADDSQLFSGSAQATVPAFSETTFTQEAFPRGCFWVST